MGKRSYVVPVKSNVKISQNFVAFSEYMIFTMLLESAVKTPKEKNVVGIKKLRLAHGL